MFVTPPAPVLPPLWGSPDEPPVALALPTSPPLPNEGAPTLWESDASPANGTGGVINSDPNSDPTHGGQCPISRAKYKTGIEYLSPADRAKLSEDVQSIPLVRYRYKDRPEREHLGFIIEDVEPSPGVDSQRDQVDLYGYTSMAVAALQQQHHEIEMLKHEIQEPRSQLSLRPTNLRSSAK